MKNAFVRYQSVLKPIQNEITSLYPEEMNDTIFIKRINYVGETKE